MALVARGKRKSDGGPGLPAVSLERAREMSIGPTKGKRAKKSQYHPRPMSRRRFNVATPKR